MRVRIPPGQPSYKGLDLGSNPRTPTNYNKMKKKFEEGKLYKVKKLGGACFRYDSNKNTMTGMRERDRPAVGQVVLGLSILESIYVCQFMYLNADGTVCMIVIGKPWSDFFEKVTTKKD